jgi:phosphatidylglycerophosphatase A
MPGTIASAVTALLLFFMSPLSWMSYFLIFSFLFIAGLVSSNCVVRIWGIRDPSCVVIDEVCGMYLALMFTPKIFVCYLCTFLIFRFFDILKVSIIKTVEKILSGGFGIMMDDFVAAGFTLILFQMIFRISLFFS